MGPVSYAHGARFKAHDQAHSFEINTAAYACRRRDWDQRADYSARYIRCLT
jgi:hypothetical protein